MTALASDWVKRPMLTCNTCSKAYGSRATLSRHERNHRNDSKHRCSKCNVTFRRRDLLNRHLLIHSGPESERHSRQRCHTACRRCKVIRCKCDGAQPCGACNSAAAECHYTTPQWRTSERDAPEPTDLKGATTSTSSQLDNNEIVPTDQTVPTISTSTDFAFAGVDELDPSLLVDDLSAGLEDTTDDGLLHQRIPSTSVNPEYLHPSVGTNFWPSLSTWQWTHQDSFFQSCSSQSLNDFVDQELLLASDHETENRETSVDTRSEIPMNQNNIHVNNPLHPADESTRIAAVKENVGNTQNDNRASVALELKLTINSMVDIAKSNNSMAAFIEDRVWLSSIARMKRILGEEIFYSDNVRTVFIDQYFDNFHPLWPLIPLDRTHTSHPFLYLSLTSIGALYTRGWKATFGSFLHKCLRSALMNYEITKQCAREEALDVGKAMLLTQVAALYFEQESAFSAAERLGASLISTAHRMRLFTITGSTQPEDRQRNTDQTNALRESQRMLVYGMLRAETFLSILFNRKPRISYEEINISLPLALWAPSPSCELEYAQSQPVLPCSGLLFSDLVRIALERHETLPDLRPVDLELLMFGLQHDVWRFCNDLGLADRFNIQRTLNHRDRETDEPASISPSGPVRGFVKDTLDFTSRNMADLKEDHVRMLDAFKKWKETMQHIQRSHRPDQHRSIYVSGLILYEISLLRLCAPVEAIQQVAYQLHEPSADDQIYLQRIYEWTCRDDARRSIQHATSIWHLLNSETSQDYGIVTKYNIMALISLHHAAAVIWAIAGSDNQTNAYLIKTLEAHYDDTGKVKLCRSNNSTLMHLFANLCLQITASWGIRSSFAKMILRLADNPLPPR